MRKIGYILLILGFFWVLVVGFDCDAIRPALFVKYHERYPATNSYSGAQFREAMGDFMIDYGTVFPRVAPPAILMFVGGVLLDLAARRAAKQKPPIIHDDKPAA